MYAVSPSSMLASTVWFISIAADAVKKKKQNIKVVTLSISSCLERVLVFLDYANLPQSSTLESPYLNGGVNIEDRANNFHMHSPVQASLMTVV